MPKPNRKETQSEFIQRAIREFIKEGLSQKEAIGRAYGFWGTYRKKK